MPVINLLQESVYVILGIDGQGWDRVLAVRKSYEGAKDFLTKFSATQDYYDLWIEKHDL